MGLRVMGCHCRKSGQGRLHGPEVNELCTMKERTQGHKGPGVGACSSVYKDSRGPARLELQARGRGQCNGQKKVGAGSWRAPQVPVWVWLLP